VGKILYAWELGRNYGHVGTFLPLGLRLRDKGHEVIVTAKDLTRVESVLGEHSFPVLQAPVWLAKPRGLPEPQVTYADILLRVGFIDKTALAGLVKAWKQLYELVKPDLLIVDHGPTALLAAHGANIRRVLLGNGFYVPPPVSPMPNIRPWLRVPAQRLKVAEEKATGIANIVLHELNAPSLNAIPDLFEVDENFLCTFAELDPYVKARPDARYWGPINIAEWGARPPWPSAPGKKIFAYLYPQYKDFKKILHLLAEGPYSTLVHVSRISEDVIKAFTSERLHFSEEPVDMAYARETCDVAICHAGPGTATAMLLAGRPLLLLPDNLECGLMARSVQKLGAGLVFNPKNKNADLKTLLRRLLEEASFTENAQAFARRYADMDQERQLAQMAERCEEIIEAKGF
jgi:UDP:flavonoid glycosyltransferase YjiC (YdhE family)